MIFWNNIRTYTSEEKIIDELNLIFPNLKIELFNFLHCIGCKLSFFECFIENKKVIEFEDGSHNCLTCRTDVNLCYKCCYWAVNV